MSEFILCLDVGNSRTKYWLLDASACLAGLSSIDNKNISSFLSADDLLKKNIVRVCGVSVCAEIADLLTKFVQDQLNQAIEWVCVTSLYQDQWGMLQNAYLEPLRLGADRWIALLAAQLIHKNCIVVDSGTAMTIDILMDGQHRGGYILPGQKMMCDSLFVNTSQVRAHFNEQVDLLPGRNTASCVQNAALLSQVACIEYLHHQYSVPIVLTGGSAANIAAALQVPYTNEVNMLLSGLKRYFKIYSYSV